MEGEVFEIIYTTYFARLKTLPKSIVPISICGKAPSQYSGLQYKKLAPKYDFFMKWKENHDNGYYISCFNSQVLSILDPAQVISDLTAMAAGHDIALVCYEKPTDFCHRHLVAKWLQDNGYDVKEWGV